jgi:aerobic C4-dicarboxylate transport protein
VARWEGELDQKQFAAAMAGQLPEEADLALSGGLQPA